MKPIEGGRSPGLSRRTWAAGIFAGLSIRLGGQQTGSAILDGLFLEGGTIIVVACSQDRIVIAADGKASFRMDGYQDEVCKLANPTRKVLFAASGLVGFGDWNAADEARTVAARIVGDNPYLSNSSLQSVAEAWTRATAAKIRTLPAKAVLAAGGSSHTAAIFAGLDRADHVNLVRATVQPVASGPGLDARTNVIPLANPGTETRYLAFGMPAIAEEFLQAKTPRAKAEVAQWSKYFAGVQDLGEAIAIRLVELTCHFEERKDLVGGSTAAIRMDGKAGVRWLRRPPSCLR